MTTTRELVQMRNTLGIDNQSYRAECEALGRCPSHPAFQHDYCPNCGTAREMATR